MRIIFVTFKLNFEAGGGSTEELHAKMRALQERGHTVSAITVFSEQNRLPAQLPYQVIAERFQSASLLPLQKAVAGLLEKYSTQADVFHLEGHFAYGAGWYRLHKHALPTVVHFNRELSSFPSSTRKTGQRPQFSLKQRARFFVESMLGSRLINRNSLLTFTSPILRDVYIDFGVAKERCLVMPDVFDSQQVISPAGAEDLVEKKESQSAFTLLSGGRLISEKGFDVLLRAISMAPSRQHYRLVITGDGPEKESLVQLAHSLKVDTSVTFMGWVDKEKVFKLMRSADVFIVPRWRPELTSMLILEAMACGTPLVVTENTALSWQADAAGVTFADEDPTDLANKIEYLYQHPETRSELVRRGGERLKELEYKALIPQLDEALRSLLR